ncbi:MAG: prenyltransferase/squalene oxidase repeat-containing protein [Planctomycetota bacterium]
MDRGIRTVALLLAVTTAVWAQANPPKGGAGKVDQAAVDAAIKKGAEFLKSRGGGFSEGFPQSELVVLTLLHADVPVNESPLEEGIKWVRELDVEKIGFRDKTYRIGMASMALWSLSAQNNQQKLAQFAYFLVANQGPQGEWDYGQCVELPKELKPPEEPGAIVSGGGEGGTVKLPPKKAGGGSQVQKKIPINPKRIGKDNDYSNTQYALLGLRACAEAGCVIPEKTWKDALKNLEAGQFPEGGWGYAWLTPENMDPNATLVHGAGEEPYGSMTCSGLCGLVICRHYIKEDWKKDKKVQKAKEWIGKNFSVEEHPNYKGRPMAGGKKQFYYYYLYALERAGMLADTEAFGKHDWYNEGATVLLAQQQADGSWPDDELKNGNIDDTCFAILFLKKATQPIVPKRISK